MNEGQVFQGRDARVPSGPRDVIVVGAGIYGLPVAFFLARRGMRVLVLEDNAIPGEEPRRSKAASGPCPSPEVRRRAKG
jgi:glycine/D-amino acid oxidase-like deaminating enzyme